MSEWVIVNGHVLGQCAYLRSLDRPWEPEDRCDCGAEDDYVSDDDEDMHDYSGDLAYEGSW